MSGLGDGTVSEEAQEDEISFITDASEQAAYNKQMAAQKVAAQNADSAAGAIQAAQTAGESADAAQSAQDAADAGQTDDAPQA